MDLFIARRGGGGGAELNFEVVGGTVQPENPKENTIWVDTPNEITSWIFSATEPGTPEEGMVWIKVTMDGNVEFNALKENGILIYPLSAKQYDGSAWVPADAMICQGGVWMQWIRYLYNAGNEFADFTGGWSGFQSYTNSNGYSIGSYTEKAGSIRIANKLGSRTAIGAAPVNRIDLTDYSSIVLNLIDKTADVMLAASTSRNSSFEDNAVAKITTNDVAGYILTLDVSKLSGEYYVGVSVWGSGGTAYYAEFERMTLIL